MKKNSSQPSLYSGSNFVVHLRKNALVVAIVLIAVIGMIAFDNGLIPRIVESQNEPNIQKVIAPPVPEIAVGTVKFYARNMYTDNGEYFRHVLSFDQQAGDVVELIPDLSLENSGNFSEGVRIQRGKSVVSVFHVSESSFITHTLKEKSSIVELEAEQFGRRKVYRRIPRDAEHDYIYVTGLSDPCTFDPAAGESCDSNAANFTNGASAFIYCDADVSDVKVCDDIVKNISLTSEEIM